MITRDEMQAAHDVFDIVLNEEVPLPIDDYDLACIQGSKLALGWILGCECGEDFKKALYALMCDIEAMGFKLTRKS